MIQLKNLLMRFRDKSQISYTNLTFESGKTYALLGASGCGKSTLLNLIAGVLTPREGSVFIDGWDICAANQKARDAFRIQNIGYIFQDFKLLEDMRVSDNIGILKLENIDISGMDALLERLGILALKSRKVCHLSGGEKQRISIARAILQNPPILILDEATAAMDTQTERNIQTAIEKLRAGKTIISIAHRLSTLRDADRLAVIDDGKLCESGTHQELLEKRGVYFNLHKIQLDSLKFINAE